VLGTPLDQFYPKGNHDLQQTLMREHLVVSQFPLGYPVTPKNFPIRNRTMALLTDATVIVEAGEKSGTVHQGWEALRLGRLLFLLESVAMEPALSWPKEMIHYGAIDRLTFAAPFVYSTRGTGSISKKSRELRDRIKRGDAGLFRQIADHVIQLIAEGQAAILGSSLRK
jgi:hypothetical protein